MKFFIISTCLLITYVTLDIIFDKQLWEKNISFATYMQDNQFYGELYLFKFFSLIIQLPIFIGVFQFMLSRKKIESILYLFLCIIGFVTNGLLKNTYHQPRPYWVESIQGLGCNMEFGKPSGHAQTSIIIYFSYLFIFYPITFKFTKARVLDEQPSKEIPNWASTLLIILAFIAMFMTGLSRVYLGVHTFSQVILGWMYGIYIVLNYQIYCHEFMLKYFQLQLETQSEDHIKFQRLSVSVTGLFVFIIALDVLLLELNLHVFNLDEIDNWIYKISECKHKEYKSTNTNILYNACFIHGTLFTFIFAFIQGCFFSQGSFNQELFNQSISQITWKQEFWRLLLYLPLVIPLPLLLIQTDLIYLTAFLIFIPVILFENWYLTIIYPNLLYQWRLQVKGDFLEYRKGQYEQLQQSQ